MKIVKINPIFGNRMLHKYQGMVQSEIIRLSGTKTIKQLIKMYGEDNVFKAYICIYLNGSYICFNESSTLGTILRYMQYGGPNMPALNILSSTSNKIGGSML